MKKEKFILIGVILILVLGFTLFSRITVADPDSNETECKLNATCSDCYYDESSHLDDVWGDDPLSGYNRFCCGDQDDPNENFLYKICRETLNVSSKSHFCNNEVSVVSCCDVTTDCVYEYHCYADNQAHALSGNSEANAYCYNGTWTDNDHNTSTCAAGNAKTNYSRCDGTGCYVGAGEPNVGEYDAQNGGSQCCGDDPNEYWNNFTCAGFTSFCPTEFGGSTTQGDAQTASFSATPVCCNAITDCINGSICYTDNAEYDIDGNGNDDVCMLGVWVDCKDNSDCQSGYECHSNVCYDSAWPMKPHVWNISSLTTTSLVNIIGYINESPINISIDVRNQDMAITHYKYQTNISNTFYSEALTTEATRPQGTNYFTIPNTAANKANFSKDKYVEFTNHNNTYFFRYLIVDNHTAGDYWQLNISPALASDVPIAVTVSSFNSSFPIGWFNITINLSSGNNTIFVYGVDNSGNQGPARTLYTFYDTTAPFFNFTNAQKNHTNGNELNVTVSDDYLVERSSINLNISDGNNVIEYTINELYCLPADSFAVQYNCSPSIDEDTFPEGRYTLTAAAKDYTGSWGSVIIYNFTIDRYENNTISISDSGKYTTIKIFNASWTPYSDPLSELDYYEYSFGTAQYPNNGWNSSRHWTSIDQTSVILDYSGVSSISVMETYYFNVRAKTKAGFYTDVASTDGIAYVGQLNNTINITTSSPVRVTYFDTDNYEITSNSSASGFRASIYSGILYNLLFYNLNTTGIKPLGINLTSNSFIGFNGSYLNISAIENSTRSIGAAQRYRPKEGYAVGIVSSFTGNYQIIFNYSGQYNSSWNEHALYIYKFGFNFSNNEIDYNTYSLLTPTRNTTSRIVNASISSLSAFVLVEDSQQPEICGDGIDNNKNGKTDCDDDACDDLPECRPSGGGGDDDGGAGGGGGSIPVIKETCYDQKQNQDESDIDCGGICATDLNKTCTDGKDCIQSSDCKSNYCKPRVFVCATPTCRDGLKNQGETEIDCGGPCIDCPTCDDGILNQREQQVDCGGPCKPCASCWDNIQNQNESGIDCGGICKPCPTCSDNLKNQGEEGVDCGGPCLKSCPVIEEPKERKSHAGIIIFLVFVLIGGAVGAVFMLAKKKEMPMPGEITQIQQEPPVKPVVMAKPVATPINIPRTPLHITEETILKLQKYVNYALANGKTKSGVAHYLQQLYWPQDLINQLMREAGDPDFMSSLRKLEVYTKENLEGSSVKKARNELLKNKWPSSEVDLLLYNVHYITTPDELKRYILYELARDRPDNEIRKLLAKVGWPHHLIDDCLDQARQEFSKEINQINDITLQLIDTKSEKEIREALISKGFNPDLIDVIMHNRFSEDRNLRKIELFVNKKLMHGCSLSLIRDTLLKAGWAIDFVDKVLKRKFTESDLGFLIELDKYIEQSLRHGMTKEIITNELEKKKWASEYIDMVMEKVHIIDDKVDKVKRYINKRLMKGDSRERITGLLVRVGWAGKLIEEIFENKA